MKTTYFRPSIHGWPFGNSYDKSIVFDGVELKDIGLCGGMCWLALHRFFRAQLVPRNLAAPVEGQPLFDDIWNLQVASLSAAKLARMFDWQSSPDLSHSLRKHSLGYRTKKEWPGIKSKLNAGKPVTLTLINGSNNFDPGHMDSHHRVVAYAYNEESVSGGSGVPEGAHMKITIMIYDPNEENSDNVELSFFLGGKRNRIKLRHNYRGNKYHGFFLDDEDRSFSNSGAPDISIISCSQKAIISADLVEYDFSFSWKCRFLPYFNIFINGISWNFNRADGEARSTYNPTDKDVKQCQSRIGNLNVTLKLPRAESTIIVQLLRNNEYSESIEVDAAPGIKCFPYIHERHGSLESCIFDKKVNDTDIYSKIDNPSNAQMQVLDSSIFRWVKIDNHAGVYAQRLEDRDPLTSPHVFTLLRHQLGNIVIPVHANFDIRNMEPPLNKTGDVRITRGLNIISDTHINNLADLAQKIFDGFNDNPNDYNQDTVVKFEYQCKDKFGTQASGVTFFHGKSIIMNRSTSIMETFDHRNFVILEAIAHELIERGLIEIEIDLPHDGNDPLPDPVGPDLYLERLRGTPHLKEKMDEIFKAECKSKRTWNRILDLQIEYLDDEQGIMSASTGRYRKGQTIRENKRTQIDQKKELESILINVLVDKTINKLHKDRRFMHDLKELRD